jgi:hypothetical protein
VGQPPRVPNGYVRRGGSSRSTNDALEAPLSDPDVKLLREVVDDPAASVRNLPTSPRKPTAEKLSGGKIRLTIRSTGPADATATEIADQVLAPGWSETRSRYPGERVFVGQPGS